MFGFVYEDYELEKVMIEKYLTNKEDLNDLNGLMILSGGCTMFEIAEYFSNKKLTCVDFNIKQVELVEKKIEFMEKGENEYNNFIDKICMPFDNLFMRINNGEKFEDVFNNNNLISQFGESAVINTNSSFITHFEKIKSSGSKYHDWIWNRKMNSKYLNDKLLTNIDYIKNVNLICGNFINLLENTKYDYIQTSNLTDWMDKDNFDLFCDKVKQALKPNGILIMRRLLSTNFLSNKFPNSIKLIDKTNFYEETICFVNSI
jgi:hypothetical protein